MYLKVKTKKGIETLVLTPNEYQSLLNELKGEKNYIQEYKTLKNGIITDLEIEKIVKKSKETAFDEPLKSIIREYKEGSEEPLDGDEVDRLTEHLRNRINLFEGNITQKEFEKLENL